MSECVTSTRGQLQHCLQTIVSQQDQIEYSDIVTWQTIDWGQHLKQERREEG